jgi:hypothetical protein
VKEYIKRTTNLPDIPSSSCWDKCTCLPVSVVDTLKDMLDISLFTDISFILISVGNLLVMTGYYIPFIYLVDHALQRGISKTDAAFLLSIIGKTMDENRNCTF